MTSYKEIMNDWTNTCEVLALEYWESNSEQDASEYAHECADGSQWAIYYGHAWGLVSAARLVRPRDLDQAESELEGDSFEFKSLDRTMTHLAYWLTYNEIMNKIDGQGPEDD